MSEGAQGMSGNRNQWGRPPYGRLRAAACSGQPHRERAGKINTPLTLLLSSDLLLVLPIGKRQQQARGLSFDPVHAGWPPGAQNMV